MSEPQPSEISKNGRYLFFTDLTGYADDDIPDLLSLSVADPAPRAVAGEIMHDAIRLYVTEEATVQLLAGTLADAMETTVTIQRKLDLPFAEFDPYESGC